MTSTTLPPLPAQALVLLEAGDLSAALDLLTRFCADSPDNPDGQFYRGDALAELGRLEEAISAYRQGLANAPDDPDALTTLGDLLLETGRHQEALEQYHQVHQLDPGT